jgi:threonine synthase
MTRFVSTKGGIAPVDFEAAVTQGFAADGGLFVPETIPRLPEGRLAEWGNHGFVDLAYEILSLFIEESVIPAGELRRLLEESFNGFEHPEIAPVVPFGLGGNRFILELFHGPTLSFKDMAMGFLINSLDFFLRKRGGRMSLLVATTGDTGPAAAHASVGKETIDCWVLYPKGLISEEQERQITTLEAPNVHAVGVMDCPDGGDDLDLVVAEMFADEDMRRLFHLSSVNSINWCRVMVQAVHYFYAYFRVVDRMGDKVVFSVPTGAFGNLFGGYLARSMGLPVETFVCANNRNAALHNVFTRGVFSKADLQNTVSSAIDIVVPYNFWRYLYFASGRDPGKIRDWMTDFKNKGRAVLDPATHAAVKDGFVSAAVSDEKTLAVMAEVYRNQDGYLLDPHAAVAVAAAQQVTPSLTPGTKVISLATAHPAKFPDVVRRALGREDDLPNSAIHPSIEGARERCQEVRLCDCVHLAPALKRAMASVAERRGQ